jgi:adenine phosphoribosyltransferase
MSSVGRSVEEVIKANIRVVQDWPKKGIKFIDLLSMLADHPSILEMIIATFKERTVAVKPDGVVAIDARGFIFAAPLAYSLGVPLLIVRKEGKLPPPTVGVDYDLEYGTATLEIAPATLKDKRSLVLVDDILATGGTAQAVIDLCGRYNVKIVEAMFVGEISFLNGRLHLGDVPVFSCALF